MLYWLYFNGINDDDCAKNSEKRESMFDLVPDYGILLVIQNLIISIPYLKYISSCFCRIMFILLLNVKINE